MAYSILQAGQSTKNKATGSLKTLSDMEQNRDMTNENLDQQKKSAQISATGTGIMAGAMIGAEIGAVGGPWGAAIGGAIGLVAGSL
ncbi:MAG: F0F1-type ATP synthase assembly protein I [Gammaproteobacteria bacterium]|jgi:F0F1-type ATP synthase assembly protein I